MDYLVSLDFRDTSLDLREHKRYARLSNQFETAVGPSIRDHTRYGRSCELFEAAEAQWP
jgi:hypothetical protein